MEIKQGQQTHEETLCSNEGRAKVHRNSTSASTLDNSFYKQKYYSSQHFLQRAPKAVELLFLSAKLCPKKDLFPFRVLHICFPHDAFYSKPPGVKKLISVISTKTRKNEFFLLQWKIIFSCHFPVHPPVLIYHVCTSGHKPKLTEVNFQGFDQVPSGQANKIFRALPLLLEEEIYHCLHHHE